MGALAGELHHDERVVGELYTALRAEGSPTILPLVVDLADASPARGWRGLERRRLEERGRPDLVLCLALVHHLAIGRNVPFAELVAPQLRQRNAPRRQAGS